MCDAYSTYGDTKRTIWNKTRENLKLKGSFVCETQIRTFQINNCCQTGLELQKVTSSFSGGKANILHPPPPPYSRIMKKPVEREGLIFYGERAFGWNIVLKILNGRKAVNSIEHNKGIPQRKDIVFYFVFATHYWIEFPERVLAERNSLQTKILGTYTLWSTVQTVLSVIVPFENRSF